MLKAILRYYYRKWYQKFHYERIKTNMLLGKQLAESNGRKERVESLDEVAFQVFSQRGEDGVIQYLLSKIAVPHKLFIEFGVEDYTESNTRFLLMNNDWRGLVLDGNRRNIRFIKTDFIHWKYDITACQAFITAENINELIGRYTACADIGLLSIDIDGNDYWVWNAIDVINPRIVVCEYNSAFGDTLPVSVPYDPRFEKTKAHYSQLYYGCSLAALCYLAGRKGYDFVGTTSAGVNAYFVRKDLSAPFKTYTAQTGFHESANRDSRHPNGALSFLPHGERLKQIADLKLVDVTNGTLSAIQELYGL